MPKGVVACMVGIVFIQVGRQNTRTRQAEETGERRSVNSVLGSSNSYTGSKAVFVGWLRIVCGVGAILFGFVFLVFGAFLASLMHRCERRLRRWHSCVATDNTSWRQISRSPVGWCWLWHGNCGMAIVAWQLWQRLSYKTGCSEKETRLLLCRKRCSCSQY